LEEAKEIFTKEKIKTKRDPYYLVNFSPLCNKEKSFKLIRKFTDNHKNMQPIYIACNKSEDEQFFKDIEEVLPNCEIFDRTQANISETLKLFYFAQ
jgi:hypothetical protein